MRSLGYTGVEFAPFTLAPPTDNFDVRNVPAARRAEAKRQAADAGLEVVGLHWLLAKTSGFHLTSPDAAVRQATAEYLKALAELCGELGGKIMVLGSPQQRKLLPGVAYNDAEDYAAEVLRCRHAGLRRPRRDDRARAARAPGDRLHDDGQERRRAGQAGRLAALQAAARREGHVQRKRRRTRRSSTTAATGSCTST